MKEDHNKIIERRIKGIDVKCYRDPLQLGKVPIKNGEKTLLIDVFGIDREPLRYSVKVTRDSSSRKNLLNVDIHFFCKFLR